jgi:membrane protein implicated in regulation of membrane protease activity
VTALHASTGILTVLAFWALWYYLDPPLRPDGLSWPRLLLWIFTPLGMYIVLYRHRDPPVENPSPVGKEGIVVQTSPLEVEVFGSFWRARCDPRTDLKPGDRVRVLERDGLSLVVEPFTIAPPA